MAIQCFKMAIQSCKFGHPAGNYAWTVLSTIRYSASFEKMQSIKRVISLYYSYLWNASAPSWAIFSDNIDRGVTLPMLTNSTQSSAFVAVTFIHVRNLHHTPILKRFVTLSLGLVVDKTFAKQRPLHSWACLSFLSLLVLLHSCACLYPALLVQGGVTVCASLVFFFNVRFHWDMDEPHVSEASDSCWISKRSRIPFSLENFLRVLSFKWNSL